MPSVGPRIRFGSFFAIRPGICAGGGCESPHSACAVGEFACSCCWTDACGTVMLTLISSTYAFRSGSLDAFQAGLRTKSMLLPGLYDAILYGPSEIVCWASAELIGR